MDGSFHLQRVCCLGLQLWHLDVETCVQCPTLFDQTDFAWWTFLPQAEAVAALGTSDGGILRRDSALAPHHSLHLRLLLLVCEGTLSLFALCRYAETEDAVLSIHRILKCGAFAEHLIVRGVLRPFAHTSAFSLTKINNTVSAAKHIHPRTSFISNALKC